MRVIGTQHDQRPATRQHPLDQAFQPLLLWSACGVQPHDRRIDFQGAPLLRRLEVELRGGNLDVDLGVVRCRGAGGEISGLAAPLPVHLPQKVLLPIDPDKVRTASGTSLNAPARDAIESLFIQSDGRVDVQKILPLDFGNQQAGHSG